MTYRTRSELEATSSGTWLRLASEGDASDVPRGFLVTRALSPDVTARSLRAVSEIVGSRFYVPPAMLARILREADPVATVSPGAVRFEGFSACCSAYIRLDLGDDALDVAEHRNGTTNVDFGPELRAALARVRRDSTLDITIGEDSVGISHESAAVVERKVPLPLRWIRGFGEVQVHLVRMRRTANVPRIAAHRFLRAQPRSKTDHLQWITVTASGLRTSARQSDGAVPLRGGHRLRVLEPLMPFADEMEIWIDDATGSTAWVLVLGAQRLTLVLNAEPWRGFSGDGGLLSDLAGADESDVAALRAQFHWQDRLVPAELAEATGLAADTLDRALARAAAEGLVGFDLATGAYFHRVLPFRLDRMERLNPRLKAARALVEAGAVELGTDSAKVTSDGVVHELRLSGDALSCTCPWHAKHKTARGPCKHALAVDMAMEAGRDGR
ncbi:SWIM zinc finger family protein [Pontivivens ytuae]|uniref:SWIM zinc finger family protein n=1 Tax=Pontivivens ytuae TaxID=2789856 RepID=UPI001E30251C|nr:SWIM zinc finger family protein [Pontivivens ytuae]